MMKNTIPDYELRWSSCIDDLKFWKNDPEMAKKGVACANFQISMIDFAHTFLKETRPKKVEALEDVSRAVFLRLVKQAVVEELDKAIQAEEAE